MQEIKPLEGESWERWLHTIRRLELDHMMANVPLDRSATRVQRFWYCLVYSR
jgi:hypothetical protein